MKALAFSIAFIIWLLGVAIVLLIINMVDAKADYFSSKYPESAVLKKVSCDILQDTILNAYAKTHSHEIVREFVNQYTRECMTEADLKKLNVALSPVNVRRD